MQKQYNYLLRKNGKYKEEKEFIYFKKVKSVREGGKKRNVKDVEVEKYVVGKKYYPVPITDLNIFLIKASLIFTKRMEYTGPQVVSKKDFQLLKLIEKGNYSKIVLATNELSNELFIVKIISKMKIINLKFEQKVLNEKKILESLRFQFTMYLEGYFKDKYNIYFVLPLMAVGDLFKFLKKRKKLSESLTKFYSAQILLGLEYLHYLNIIYRALKPESILMDHRGYVKLTDFSFCCIGKERTYTFCGTPEYLAPEILENKGYGKSIDWWAFGIIIFEMSHGCTPFYSSETTTLFSKILIGKINFPIDFSFELSDLIKNLLQIDITKRFGNIKSGIEGIKKHDWFKSIGWMSLLNGIAIPPYTPTKTDLISCIYFKDYVKENKTSFIVEETSVDSSVHS